MIPLVYIGIISFISSFSLANVLTREYLRHECEKQLYESISTKTSLVKFNKCVTVKEIPSVKDISSNTLSELWYNMKDYDLFKKDYILSKKHNSI